MELNPIDIPGVKSQLLMFYVISSKNVTTVSWLLFNLNILSIIFQGPSCQRFDRAWVLYLNCHFYCLHYSIWNFTLTI
jgi:hypothetical protein